jgi:hypothetical protein
MSKDIEETLFKAADILQRRKNPYAVAVFAEAEATRKEREKVESKAAIIAEHTAALAELMGICVPYAGDKTVRDVLRRFQAAQNALETVKDIP